MSQPKKNKKSPSKSTKVAKKPWVLKTLVKLFFVFMAIFIAAGIYLDAQIKQKFEGNKWQLPALIYGVEHNYQKSDALSRTALIEHLKLLDYRQVRRLSAPGEFEPTRSGVRFYRRAYSLPHSEVDAQQLEVSFYKNRIDRIAKVGESESDTQAAFSLEPYLIGRLQANNLEDRILVKLHQVPDLLIQTLLLVEDQNFYSHHGVAPLSIARALWVNIQAGRTVQGGSTLTQQLVKNMFLTNERSLWRKIKEAYMAVILDARYNKSEILEAYLNEVYLGQNHSRSVNGMGLASHYYFAKPLDELAPNEIALLIGIIKGPSYYNPRYNLDRALKRRDLILRLMTENNLISAKDYQYEITRKVIIQDKNAIAKRRYPAYLDQVQAELKRVLQINHKVEMHSGLKIFTHFDPLAQNQAQTAISKGLTQIEQQRKLADLQAASIVVDSHTGGIQAIVGDRQANFDGFNRALNAERNIGSLIKPAIYLTALEQNNYHLASVLKDEPITLTNTQGKKWTPKNYDKQFLGEVLLVDALVNSRNIPTVNLGMALGLDTVANTLNDIGLDRDIRLYPSMLLGSVTLSPFEVADLYQVFSNEGNKQKIHAINTVNSMDNQQLWQFNQASTRVIERSDAYLINYAMNQVTRKGSAKWLGSQFKRHQFAGKTGTTNDLLDSWFVGYDQTQLAVFWVGHDDNQSTKLTGATGALRLFGEYQKLRTPSSLVMAKPDAIEMRYFNRQTGRHSLPGCEALIMLPAKVEHLAQPQECAQSKEWDKPEKSWLEKLFDW